MESDRAAEQWGLSSPVGNEHFARLSEGQQVFTNDREKLPVALGRDVSHQSAHVPEMAKAETPDIAPKQEHSYGLGISM